MGKTGRSIVKTDLKEVIADLNRAYADEWLAHYHHWLAAQWIRSLDADTLRPVLIQQSEDELNHAKRLAQRIVELGGMPLMNPRNLLEVSGCGYKEPPHDPTDLKRLVQDVLDAESCAIQSYSKMTEKYRNIDVVTHELFEDLLKDEVEDEETWERFMANL